MTDEHTSGKDPLQGLFQLARDSDPAPSGDFMARVLADALAAQPLAAAPGPVPRRRRGRLWRALGALGGGLGLAGLGTAAVAGLVIGYVQPDPLLSLGESFGVGLDVASLDLTSGFDTLLAEETAP